MLASDVDELFHFEGHDAAVWLTGDSDRPSAAHLDDALLAQDSQGPQNGVGVDAQLGGQVFGLRNALAGTRLTVGDRPADLRGDLLVEQGRIAAIETRESQRLVIASRDIGLARTHENNYSGFMTIITRPSESRENLIPPTESTSTDALELLFKEAKQRARRRKLRWFAVALVVALTAGVVAGVTYGAGGSTARGHAPVPPLALTSAKVLTCQGTGVVRPRTYIITCADGYTQLTNTHWTTWTAKSAAGITTFAMNLCKPYCAASKMTYYPNSAVSFTSPVATKHGSLFSLLTVRYRSGGRPHVFHFSYRGDPSFTK